MAMYLAVRQERAAFAQTYFQGRIVDRDDYDLVVKKQAQTMGKVLYKLNPNGTTAPITIPAALHANCEPFARCLLEDSSNPLRDSMKQKEKWLRNPDELHDCLEQVNQFPNFTNQMNTYRAGCQALALTAPFFKGSGLITLMEFGIRHTVDANRVMSMEMVNALRDWQYINGVDKDDAIFYGDTYNDAEPKVMDMMEHQFNFLVMKGVFCRYVI